MKCQTTGCNNECEAEHTCPWKEELIDDEDAKQLCNCCEDCTQDCLEEI